MKKIKFKGQVNEWSVMLFNYQLDQIDDTEDIEIHVNSGGGGIFLGMDMHSTLSNWKGKTTCIITGLAASMGSVFPLACNEVKMMKGTSLMIHDPSTLTIGNIRDHKQNLQALEAQKENIISIYKDKLNKTDEELKDIMENETWFTAKQAVEIGFASEIINKTAPKENAIKNEETDYMTSMVACLTDYNNVPDDIKSQYGLNEENENENTLEDSMPMSAEQQKEMDDLKAQALEDSKKIGGLEAKVSTLEPQAELVTGLQAANDALTTTNEELTVSKEAAESKLTALESEKLTAESEKAFKNDYPFLIDEDGSQLSALMQAKKLGNEAIVATIENSYKQLNAARDPKVNSMLNEIGADGDPEPKKSTNEMSVTDYNAKVESVMAEKGIDKLTAMGIIDDQEA